MCEDYHSIWTEGSYLLQVSIIVVQSKNASYLSKNSLFSDKHKDKPETIASKKMLDMAGIKYRQFTPKNGRITIDFSAIEN